jgi:predicted glycogen debranching enzyme
MTDTAPLRTLRPQSSPQEDALHFLRHEWLVANGLGGYASGTVAGASTRRYHGLLIAAQPAPLGRVLMLRGLSETLVFDSGRSVSLATSIPAKGEADIGALRYLEEFRLEYGLPVWRFRIDDTVLERRIVMPYRQNTVYICYCLIGSGQPVQLRLRPAIHIRLHDADCAARATPERYAMTISANRYEVSAGAQLPPLRLMLHGKDASLVADGERYEKLFLPVEADRNYGDTDTVWSPGYFSVDPGDGIAALVASVEPWGSVSALSPVDALVFERDRRCNLIAGAAPEARDGVAAELVLAADQFLFRPVGRLRERVRAQATGDAVRAVIAGYHWFTDWGRDTMISLEGLTLVTRRYSEARWILLTMNRYVRDGLVPNLIPEGADEGLYHTADATLWFFHAVDRYLAHTGDTDILKTLLPQLLDIARHHAAGTLFGIGVDPGDGLLRQGMEGYQLTWMDAKVDNWVVTPRRGKAVEINALWYNALRLLAGWLAGAGEQAEADLWTAAADKAYAAFNRRFWYPCGSYLYDVIDGEHGDDAACRPNQLFSISLRHPVLSQDRWEPVLKAAEERLLTPVGLRTLAPEHPEYKSRYFGDLRNRDAAYHQGTVWPWLIGPFVDAWLAVHPEDRTGARRFLDGFGPLMEQYCLGTIAEICDAEKPFTPRGCISQAWSVAEVLRAWAKTGSAP